MSVGLSLALLVALCVSGAVVGALMPDRLVPRWLASIGALASLLALWASGDVMRTGTAFHARLWTVGSIDTLSVTLDPFAAIFLSVTACVVLASSVFSASYLRRYVGRYSLRAFNAWYLLLVACIVWVLIASDVFGFLLAWEGMSITSYLLVAFERHREEAGPAAYAMLAMGEVGFMAVAVVLIFLGDRAGSLDFAALPRAASGLGVGARWVTFVLVFFGFGVKAGLVPVNSWLPRAHPAAPANVSAILSGAILNLGLYGIARVNLDLVPGGLVGPGILVLIVGSVSALVGILYATTEPDLKAVLAHSSIENVGIVTVGFGAGLVFDASGHPVLAGIALLAAFYHLINHSIYKTLLFLGAGVVDARTRTRDLDQLGGLIHMMPWTAGTFLVGVLAISAFPPFSGFVSEWLTLQALLRSAELPSIGIKVVFALCGAALALTAALAVTCFARVFAMGFLGIARSSHAATASEAPRSAIVPMAALAVLCVVLGVLPTYVLPALNRQLTPMVTAGASRDLVPPFFVGSSGHDSLPAPFMKEFHALGAQTGQAVLSGPGLVMLHRGGTDNPVVFAASPAYLAIVLAALLVCTAIIVRRGIGRSQCVVRRECWDGGVRRLLPEMTYTATGFANPVRVIFQAVFHPTIVEDTQETVAVHFRTAIRRRAETVHIVDRLIVVPARAAMMWLAFLFARMHRGRLNAYLAYVLLSLVAVLVGVLAW